MNLLHVHSGNMFGGVERMLETLAPGIAGDAPLRSEYALCFDGRAADALEAAGGTVHRLGEVHSRRMDEIWRARRTLRSVLASRRWDAACVHSAWSQGIFGGTIARSGLPLVRWLHAPEPGPRWMEIWAARSRPSLVICNSQYTRRAARDRFGDVPMTVCHPPARISFDTADSREAIRQSLGTPTDLVAVVIAARLEPWKGHVALIDGLATLPRGNWELWVLGGPQQLSERGYLDSLVARSETLGGRVRFLGEQKDVDSWLRAADIYCQPNTGPEPFGLAFVEALASGLPVVTTDLGAAPEIVDETCGVLTSAASLEALAAALDELIGDGAARARLSAGARARARAFCDLPNAIARIAQALEPVAAQSLSLT
jgi:glycosyltransferase involved in cell wall biosynthesis